MHITADHLVDQRDQDPRPTGSDRMADGNGSAVNVHFVGIEEELAHHTERVDRESFIKLVEIHMFIVPAGLLLDFTYCAHCCDHYPFGIDAASFMSHNAVHQLTS